MQAKRMVRLLLVQHVHLKVVYSKCKYRDISLEELSVDGTHRNKCPIETILRNIYKNKETGLKLKMWFH